MVPLIRLQTSRLILLVRNFDYSPGSFAGRSIVARISILSQRRNFNSASSPDIDSEGVVFFPRRVLFYSMLPRTSQIVGKDIIRQRFLVSRAMMMEVIMRVFHCWLSLLLLGVLVASAEAEFNNPGGEIAWG
jgi:hypothetical protein